MRLVCVTEDWIRKYQELCEQRQLNFIPWLSPRALMVAEGKDLVAGVMVYDSTGPFLFFEHLVTNETATHRQRWAAVDLMASEVLVMCRHAGKLPQIIVRHKGIAKILRRHGLRPTGAESFTCTINNLETHDYEKPQFAAQYSRCIPYSAPTEPVPAGHPEEHPGVYASVLGGAGG